MADEDYQDDYYDENFSSYPNSPTRPRNNNEEDEEANNGRGVDEQVTQKLTEQIETLTQQLEESESQLEKEREKSLQLATKYEEEIKLAWTAQSKAEDRAIESNTSSNADRDELKTLKKEISRLVKENEDLHDRVELLMITNSGKAQSVQSTTAGNGGGSNKTVESVPLSLEEEFHRFCERNELFPELFERVLTTEDCVKVLRSLSQNNSFVNGKKKKKSHSSTKKSASHEVDAEDQEEQHGEQQDSVAAEEDAAAEDGKQSKRPQRLSQRLRVLERELQAASIAVDSDHMKQRVLQLSDRIRVEKDHRQYVESELQSTKRKVDMLSDHIEKLVAHLKREGAHKVRLAEQVRNAERDSQRIKEKADIVYRKSAAKDRLVLELREGSKVLEDQLRLMDEKYLELRGKLDFARSMAWKKIRKAEKEAADLRVKFAMSGQSHLLLDTSSQSTMRHSQSMPSSVFPGGSAFDDFEEQDLGSPDFHNSSGFVSIGKVGKSRSVVINDRSVVSRTTQRSQAGSTTTAPPSMDVVLEKIRVQAGTQQVWTESKAKQLTKSR